jgi:hypothetical protein
MVRIKCRSESSAARAARWGRCARRWFRERLRSSAPLIAKGLGGERRWVYEY